MQDQDRPGFQPPEWSTAAEPTGPTPYSPSEVIASGPRRSRIGTGVAIAASAIGGLGVAGTAYASSSTPAPAPGTSSGSPHYGASAPGNGPMAGGRGDADGDGGRGPGGMGMRGGMGLGMGIHGSFVTPKRGGGYQRVATQRGTVTEVSATSIKVTSVDGFEATYVVTAETIVNAKRDGIAAVKHGDTVGVLAIVTSGTSTAVRIVDRTQLAGSAWSWAPQRPSSATVPGPTSSGTA
jgi:hypothetical protein